MVGAVHQKKKLLANPDPGIICQPDVYSGCPGPVTVARYGTWRSPVSAAALVEQAVRLSQLQVDGDRVYWNEGRPAEAGRQVIMSLRPGAAPVEEIPPGFSARTQVHEYGGRCYAVQGDTLVFSNWEDQRLWRCQSGADPVAITPAPAARRAHRYADPVITPDGRWVICVHEQHRSDAEVDNDLVAVPLDPSAPDESVRPLVSGHDFFSSPRLAPDGARLAWLSWDHPHMPWDQTQLWVGDFAGGLVRDAHVIAGRPGESVTQPRWSASGVLHYVSDRTGWWNLYDETGTALCPLDAEFGPPDWVFGSATYGFLPDHQLVAVWAKNGRDHLGYIAGGRATPQDLPFSSYAELQPAPGGVVALAASETQPPAIVRLDDNRGDQRAAPQPGCPPANPSSSPRRTPWRSRPGPARSPTPSSTHPGTRPSSGLTTSDLRWS